jgi:hypothetical protein
MWNVPGANTDPDTVSFKPVHVTPSRVVSKYNKSYVPNFLEVPENEPSLLADSIFRAPGLHVLFPLFVVPVRGSLAVPSGKIVGKVASPDAAAETTPAIEQATTKITLNTTKRFMLILFHFEIIYFTPAKDAVASYPANALTTLSRPAADCRQLAVSQSAEDVSSV